MAEEKTPRRRGSVEACVDELPGVIKIGAYDWAVRVKDELDDKYGQADFELNHINIWRNNLTSAGHAVGIVLHECLHVIFDNQSLGQLKRDKEEREEQIVLGFEAGLISLYRDNPKFVSWMKKWLRHG
jgi:hypothetical protein